MNISCGAADCWRGAAAIADMHLYIVQVWSLLSPQAGGGVGVAVAAVNVDISQPAVW